MKEQEALVAPWHWAIRPGGRKTGFLHKFERHALAFVDHGPECLVVTFDNLAELGNTGLHRGPWAYDFYAARGCSVLGVMARKGIWFREPELITALQRLADDGFFARFKKVLFTGNSMGGFGALAFSRLAPGADVLAFSPQSTLDKAKVPWEPRYEKAWSADWTLPCSDAAEGLDSAGQVTVIYDPYVTEDRRHADRISGPNVQKLTAWYGSHKTPVFLRRLDILKSVSDAALQGTLTPALFYDLYRQRRATPWYRNSLINHAKRRGHGDMAARLAASLARTKPAEEKAAADALDTAAQAMRNAANAARDGAAMPDGPAIVTAPPAQQATEKVGLIGITHDGDVFLDRWLSYHAAFLDRQRITLLYSGAAPVGTGCNLLPAGDTPWAFASVLANHLTTQFGAAAALTTSEFLVLDPKAGDNPFTHMMTADARAVISPFGIEIAHHRHHETDPLPQSAPILASRRHFRPNTRHARPALTKSPIRWSADGRRSTHPHLNLSETLFLFDISHADHDLACRNAAQNPTAPAGSPTDTSLYLDKISALDAEERDPCIYWAHHKTYKSWIETDKDADGMPGFEPFALKKRLFTLPERFNTLF